MMESPSRSTVPSELWCGSAQFAPKQISVSKLGPIAPSSLPMALYIAATSTSLIPARMPSSVRSSVASFIRDAARIRSSSSASLRIRASSTGRLPSTGRTSPRASISRIVNWLGQNLSIPSFPGFTASASTATESSVSSNSTRFSPSVPESANNRFAYSTAVPSSFTSSASIRSPGDTHVPVR